MRKIDFGDHSKTPSVHVHADDSSEFRYIVKHFPLIKYSTALTLVCWSDLVLAH